MRKRQKGVLVRFYENEIALIDSKAKRAGIPREQYIREAASNKKIHEVPPADYKTFIFELRRVGQHLNRILQIAYTNGFLDIASLNYCLDVIRSLTTNINKEFFGDNAEVINGNDKH